MLRLRRLHLRYSWLVVPRPLAFPSIPVVFVAGPDMDAIRDMLLPIAHSSAERDIAAAGS